MRSVVQIYLGPPTKQKAEGRKQKEGDDSPVRLLTSAFLLLLFRTGAVAQLGEHLLCKQGVVGSIPISSTTSGVRDQRPGISRGQSQAVVLRFRFALVSGQKLSVVL